MLLLQGPDLKFYKPVIRPERKVNMKLGGDFFKVFNFAVQLIRLFFKVFGDDDDKKKAVESEVRSKNPDGDAC